MKVRVREFLRGKGLMRAYLSLSTDLRIMDGVKDYTEALHDAFEEVKSGHVDWGKLRKWSPGSFDVTPPKAPPTERPPVVQGVSVLSLFTGAYGLDLGFEIAGYDIVLGLDISKASYENLKANRDIPFINDDISRYRTDEILKEAGDVDVVIGGPPCQPFSFAGKRRGWEDPRSKALIEFTRVVREARPKVFVMEEVRGVLGTVDLPSLFPGYKVSWGVLNSLDFGAPQSRERLFVLGFRSGRDPSLPRSSGSSWLTLAETIMDVKNDVYVSLPPKYAKFLKYVPGGGNWRLIPDEMKAEALNNSKTGGRTGLYRRLSWFEPSPTLVTSPVMKATMLTHPWENRPLGVREYLRIQGFPDDWKVVVPVREAYRLFGEAVPVPLSYAIASHVGRLMGWGTGIRGSIS